MAGSRGWRISAQGCGITPAQSRAYRCDPRVFRLSHPVTLSVAEGSEMLRQAQHDMAGKCRKWHDNRKTLGVIPSELGMLTGLETLDLSHNRLTGAIPSELGSLDNIRFLRLHATRLSGSIPVEFRNLKNLVTLDLGQTHLTGEIPRELGGLPNLRELFLGSNFHTGELPAELTQLPNLRALNISNNRLSGCVPTELRDIAPNIGAMRFCGDPLPIRSDTGPCSMVASIWA